MGKFMQLHAELLKRNKDCFLCNQRLSNGVMVVDSKPWSLVKPIEEELTHSPCLASSKTESAWGCYEDPLININLGDSYGPLRQNLVILMAILNNEKV